MALTSKVLEIRDRNTFIAAIATSMSSRLQPTVWYLRRCGYDISDPQHPSVLLARLDGGGKALSDPYEWNDRTMQSAHLCILRDWTRIGDGSVIDVEWFLGETKKKKESERYST